MSTDVSLVSKMLNKSSLPISLLDSTENEQENTDIEAIDMISSNHKKKRSWSAAVKDLVASDVLEFKKIDSLDVKLTNALLQHVNILSAPLENTHVDIQYDPKLSRVSVYMAVDLLVDGSRASLLFDKKAAATLLGTLLPVENIVDLPDALRLSACEAALSNSINYFESVFNKSITFRGIRYKNIKEEFTSSWCFGIKNNSGGGAGLLSLQLDNPAKEILIDILETLPAFSNEHLIEQVTAPIRVIVGKQELDLQDVQALSLGDVLLVGNTAFQDIQTVEVQFGPNLKTQASWIDNILTFNKPPEAMMEGLAMHDNKDETSSSIEELKIKLIFEVGNQELSLAELKNIQAGYTFQLDSDMNMPVTIRANGNKIANGQLVQVGEQLGVKILELANGATR